ncbi:MAG: aspartate dehydrogenase [Candidatus Omnitrophica bacterium]|nr:aspartate dehydrogenase [Candidatus Omnitrophota bacterium]
MVKMLKIGIVGCGAIGGSLAKIIKRDFAGRAFVAAVYDIADGKAADLSKRLCGSGRLAAGTLKQLIARSDLVIEAASAAHSREIARQALGARKDIMIMSVGGIVSHAAELRRLAQKNGSRVFIPSGAIAGIDGLKASGGVTVKKVILTTRKHPRSFAGVRYIQDKKIDLEAVTKDTVLFSGSAKDATVLFPQNINVAAVLSLAGIGAAKTEVRIIASPDTRNNIHEIEIESSAGKIFTRTENVLHPENPKTSYLAVLSAAAALRQIIEPVRVGT